METRKKTKEGACFFALYLLSYIS